MQQQPAAFRRASDWGISRARSNCGHSLHTQRAALGSIILLLEWGAWNTHKLGTRIVPWPSALLKGIHSIWLSGQNCGQSSEIIGSPFAVYPQVDDSSWIELLRGEAAVKSIDCRKCLDLFPVAGTVTQLPPERVAKWRTSSVRGWAVGVNEAAWHQGGRGWSRYLVLQTFLHQHKGGTKLPTAGPSRMKRNTPNPEVMMLQNCYSR